MEFGRNGTPSHSYVVRGWNLRGLSSTAKIKNRGLGLGLNALASSHPSLVCSE